MDRWSLNDRDIETINAVSSDILLDMQTPVYQRPGFVYTDSTVTIPRYFYRFIGIDTTEDDYYGYLDKVQQATKEFGNLGICITDGFSKQVDTEFERKFESCWSRISLFTDVTAENVIAALVASGLFVEFPKDVLRKQIVENAKGLIGYYFDLCKDRIDPDEFHDILFGLLNWSRVYMPKLFLEFDYVAHSPKVFYYGSLTKQEAYFLLYLSSFGCDILYFNPQADGEIAFADPEGVFSHAVVSYKREMIRPLQVIKEVERLETLAYQSKQETEELLGTETTMLFKPWQCIGSKVKTVTLKSTFEDLKVLWKADALVRSGWAYSNKIVTIPNLFAKVNGTYRDINRYFSEIHELLRVQESSVLFSSCFPLNWYSKVQAPLSQLKLNVSNLRGSPYWPYQKLRDDIEEVLAEKMIAFVSDPRVRLPQHVERQQLILSVLFGLTDEIQNALQSFDYPKAVPKAVVFNDGKSGEFQLEDAILITFLNMMGFDIAIFTPSGYNDIETYSFPELFDQHNLETMSFDLPFRPPTRGKKDNSQGGLFRKLISTLA